MERKDRNVNGRLHGQIVQDIEKILEVADVRDRAKYLDIVDRLKAIDESYSLSDGATRDKLKAQGAVVEDLFDTIFQGLANNYYGKENIEYVDIKEGVEDMNIMYSDNLRYDILVEMGFSSGNLFLEEFGEVLEEVGLEFKSRFEYLGELIDCNKEDINETIANIEQLKVDRELSKRLGDTEEANKARAEIIELGDHFNILLDTLDTLEDMFEDTIVKIVSEYQDRYGEVI